jgi:tetratricopeptide (TPR) repeat protein
MTTRDDAIRQWEAGDFTGAEATCLAILGQTPDDGYARWLLAVSRSCQGRPAEAIDTLREFAGCPDAAPFHLFHLGRCQAQLGLIDEALDSLARAAPHLPAARTAYDELTTRPCFGLLQGSHAPERQAYLSAVAWLKRAGDGQLRILEVGTFMGASAYTLACAVATLTERRGHLLCVDAWEEADPSEYTGSDTSRPMK